MKIEYIKTYYPHGGATLRANLRTGESFINGFTIRDDPAVIVDCLEDVTIFQFEEFLVDAGLEFTSDRNIKVLDFRGEDEPPH